MDNKTKELEYLLNNFWCIKEQDSVTYYNLKNNLDYYKDFIQNKLGSRLIVNERFIKLEKIPSLPKSYMGIMDFTDPIEYNILFIILLFLEDKPKLEQFILSNLIEFIRTNAISLKLDNLPDWNKYHHRKCLVKVIDHLKEMGIIRVVEEQNSFSEDVMAEALYETTGLSNFYVREFKNNILDYKNITDYVNDEFSEQNDSLGDVRRYKVYRHLLYSLVSYTEELPDAEIDYLRRFRTTINNEIEKYTKADLEITKNMAVLMYSEDTKAKFDFPNNKAITDIILLTNYKILEKIDNQEFLLDKFENTILSKEMLERIIKDVRGENYQYLSKNFKDMKNENFIKEVINYMLEYDFIKKVDLGYKIYPIVSKFVGYIPKDDKEQLNIFGGGTND